MKIAEVDPKTGNRKHRMWAGQYLNPGLRYVYTVHSDSGGAKAQRLYVARSTASEPFTFDSSQEEAVTFQKWIGFVVRQTHSAWDVVHNR